eukprot:200487-Lingulodinium_polyedra.AAC.1
MSLGVSCSSAGRVTSAPGRRARHPQAHPAVPRPAHHVRNPGDTGNRASLLLVAPPRRQGGGGV